MATNYIPTAEGPYLAWSSNLSNMIEAAPQTYGLTVAQATALETLTSQYQAANQAAEAAASRSPITIAARRTARENLEPLQRNLSQLIQANISVTAAQKTALGLTVAKARAPIPAPTSAPIIGFTASLPGTVSLTLSDANGSSAKPYGVRSIELRRADGVAQSVDPEQAKPLALITKSRYVDSSARDNSRPVVTYFARYLTASGPGGLAQYGPWSVPTSV